MGVTEKTLYRYTCDECGKVYEEYEDNGWNEYEPITLMADNWSAIYSGRRLMVYCPEHLHPKCVRCLKQDTGSFDELKKQGWFWVNMPNAMCPDCKNIP